jgi:hypothetical protein
MQATRAKFSVWGAMFVLLALAVACGHQDNEQVGRVEGDQPTPIAIGVEEDKAGGWVEPAESDRPSPASTPTKPSANSATTTPGWPCTVMVNPGSSIQRMIEQAQPGAVICLAAGTWDENLVIIRSLTLRGEGESPGEVRIAGVEEGHPVIRIAGEEEIDVTLEDLSVARAKGDECAESGQLVCPAGIAVLGNAKATIHNVEISDNRFAGLVTQDSPQVSLSKSSISGNQGDGLTASFDAQVSLSDTIVYDNQGSGLVADLSGQINLHNSTVSGNQGDGIRVMDWVQVEVQDSRFLGNGGCGLRVVSAEAQVQGTLNEMQGNGVDLCGFASPTLRKPLAPQTDRYQLSVPGDYATLQEAVDAVAHGGTITVAADTFVEGLTLWKPVVIQGAGKDRTFLKGQAQEGFASDVPIFSIPTFSIIDEARDVVIKGLTVSSGAGSGLLVYGQAELQDLQVSENGGAGLEMLGSAVVDLTNVQVSGNGRDGLSVGEQATVNLREGSAVSDNEGDGLSVLGSAKVSLTDVQVSGNKSDGFSVGERAQVNLNDSTISNGGDDGVTVAGSAQMSFTDVTISGNPDDGIIIFGSAQVSVSNSNVSGNGQMGLIVFGQATVDLTEVRVSDNGINGLSVGHREGGSSATVTLTNSQVSGNAENGLLVGEAAQVELHSSTVEGNGVKEECQRSDTICNGLLVLDQARVTLNDSVIRNNADWGVSTWMKKCGYGKDRFAGQISLQDMRAIEENNASGNQDGMSNPGEHLFEDLSDGQVCLP